MTVQPILPATAFLPERHVPAFRTRPVLRQRALCIGEGAADWLRAPLAETVADCTTFADPYSAMTVLTDDPTDWLLCAMDGGVFQDAATACGFLRLLRFEAPNLPLILANATAMDDCAADLVLAGFDETGADAVRAIAETRLRQRGTLVA